MQAISTWFQKILSTAIRLYFQEECEVKSLYEITPPASPLWTRLSGRTEENLSFEEKVLLTLAFMPHIEPQALDILYLQNKKLDRPYTEFGGWKGTLHGGFLPTGETAAFIIAGNNLEKRQEVISLLSIEHWLSQEDLVHCEGQGEGEPFLSGRLIVSEEILAQLNHKTYEPICNNLFPAKRITTSLEWNDLVLPYYLREE
ncbi:MAG: ATP-binding protein, partial [Bacteroidales bacterium]